MTLHSGCRASYVGRCEAIACNRGWIRYPTMLSEKFHLSISRRWLISREWDSASCWNPKNSLLRIERAGASLLRNVGRRSGWMTRSSFPSPRLVWRPAVRWTCNWSRWWRMRLSDQALNRAGWLYWLVERSDSVIASVITSWVKSPTCTLLCKKSGRIKLVR